MDFLKSINAFYPYIINYKKYNKNFMTSPNEAIMKIDSISTCFNWSATFEGRLFWRLINDIGNMLYWIIDNGNISNMSYIIEQLDIRLELIRQKEKQYENQYIDSLVTRIRIYATTRYIKFILSKQ